MPTRISTGSSVQTTSISVLCVVCEGTGLRAAAEAPHRVQQQAEHEQADDRHDPAPARRVHPAGHTRRSANTGSARRARRRSACPCPMSGPAGCRPKRPRPPCRSKRRLCRPPHRRRRQRSRLRRARLRSPQRAGWRPKQARRRAAACASAAAGTIASSSAAHSAWTALIAGEVRAVDLPKIIGAKLSVSPCSARRNRPRWGGRTSPAGRGFGGPIRALAACLKRF